VVVVEPVVAVLTAVRQETVDQATMVVPAESLDQI
jgi:hypothetical protein|tara:strand:- start:79 stop:183 length:105 start_codon:yes stop_codon:yes gene_type:complete